jgi:DNA polymerase-3 subunit delta'
MLMSSIFGQQQAVHALESALKGGRLHHAWVFSGPKGVGKHLTALWFAERLLGRSNSRDLHCICKEDVTWAQNPALQKRKQTNIPIDLLRERIVGGKTSDGKTHDSVAFKTSFEGGKKVFIIDEAELLDEAGQNSLLKTLEEPPLGTIIILVTSREDLLLPTITSRCQSVMFSPLGEDEMVLWSQSRNLAIECDNVGWVLQLSGGSPGFAYEIVTTGMYALYTEISGFLAQENRGGYVRVCVLITEFIESSVALWLKENKNASKEAANRRAFLLVLLLFGHAARGSVRGDRVAEGVALTDIITDIELQLHSNVSMKVLIESLVARWSNVQPGALLQQ